MNISHCPDNISLRRQAASTSCRICGERTDGRERRCAGVKQWKTISRTFRASNGRLVTFPRSFLISRSNAKLGGRWIKLKREGSERKWEITKIGNAVGACCSSRWICLTWSAATLINDGTPRHFPYSRYYLFPESTLIELRTRPVFARVGELVG